MRAIHCEGCAMKTPHRIFDITEMITVKSDDIIGRMRIDPNTNINTLADFNKNASSFFLIEQHVIWPLLVAKIMNFIGVFKVSLLAQRKQIFRVSKSGH